MDLKMRLLVFLLFMSLFVGNTGDNAYAKIHKWVDENGVTHYSEFPPEDQETENVYEPTESSKTSTETEEKRQTLLNEVREGNFENVKKLIQQGVDVDVTTESGKTPLILAADSGNVKIAKLLVENGADIQAQDNEGFSALFIFSHDGYLDAAKFFLDKGSDIEAENKDGETAVMWCLWRGHFDVVKMLVEAGADIHRTSNSGESACKIAKESEDEEIKRFFKEEGCDNL